MVSAVASPLYNSCISGILRTYCHGRDVTPVDMGFVRVLPRQEWARRREARKKRAHFSVAQTDRMEDGVHVVDGSKGKGVQEVEESVDEVGLAKRTSDRNFTLPKLFIDWKARCFHRLTTVKIPASDQRLASPLGFLARLKERSMRSVQLGGATKL